MQYLFWTALSKTFGLKEKMVHDSFPGLCEERTSLNYFELLLSHNTVVIRTNQMLKGEVSLFGFTGLDSLLEGEGRRTGGARQSISAFVLNPKLYTIEKLLIIKTIGMDYRRSITNAWLVETNMAFG
jgi:hypothetical protein